MLHPSLEGCNRSFFIVKGQERGMQEKLTIQDVARLAGVSKATVSRVLNRNPTVDPVLSERVIRVVQEHGFVPNVTATGLARGRTRLIGVLTPPLTWPALPEILRGVAEYVEDTPYEIVLYSINFERDHSDVLDRILSMNMVSGLLAVLPGGELSRHLTARFQAGLSLVMIDDQEKPGNVPWVGIDNSKSAYEATKHLLQLGHRRIAHMQGPLHYYCTHERYEGYCQALAEVGIVPERSLLLQGSFDVASGRRCAEELFSRPRSTWPSAIFVGNDQMAYGLLGVAEQKGVQIPEELAVVGFDDNLLSAHLRPALTTIRQPFSEMGHLAVETLLTMIEPDHRQKAGPYRGILPHISTPMPETSGNQQPVRIQLATNLVVRASCGASQTLSPER